MSEISRPFCDEELQKPERVIETCCKNQSLINVSRKIVCIECGSVHRFDFASEYIDFHPNKNRIRRKSIYQRKYYINNVIESICQDNNYYISIQDRDRIMKIFKVIGSIIPEVNKGRKRMISLKYIIQQIFTLVNLSFEVQITKSKKTIAFYENYWNQILLLTFDKIMKIIQQ